MKESTQKKKNATGGSSTVLIVEDESSLNEAYQIILSQAGYNVLTAYDGAEALEIVTNNDPEVILLDLRMPVMNGIEFLKNYSPKNRAHIVVFSNYDMQKEIDEAYKLGADRYILKAWASPKELLQIVKDAIKSRA
ncbi:MAG: response regulator [bacterium]|nr:response regulator [bacterium]